MSDIKFACPNCQQHIQADEGYGGQQINCPTCNALMIVPGTAPAPVALQAPPPPPPPPPGPAPAYSRAAAAPAANTCPSCGGPVTRATVLCPKCGFNIATGKGLAPGAAAARMGKSAGEEKWYATPYPYLGLFVLVVAALALLARHNTLILFAYLGISLLYLGCVQIIMYVFAFKEGVGTGLLTLFFPPYAFRFVFRKSESSLLKALYGAGILVGATFWLLDVGSK